MAAARGRCSGRDVPRCREDVGGASRKRKAADQGGYKAEVIRIGQDKSRNRSAVKVRAERENGNLDDSVESAHAISSSL
jgi:uncharacterized protein with von Willebrand factor type A (vWA) domain